MSGEGERKHTIIGSGSPEPISVGDADALAESDTGVAVAEHFLLRAATGCKAVSFPFNNRESDNPPGLAH
jgi:hypothetical protein